MESKISLRMMDEEKDEERQPLNAMVTENLKNIIIRRIYKDVEKNVGAQKRTASLYLRQYLAALGPISGALSSGMSAGYSAILLPQLMREDSEIPITQHEGSWIASMMALPLIFGCLLSGYLMDSLGRKNSQILSCVPFTVGWIILALAPNVEGLYVGRFVTGFCVGLITPMCQVYIAEISRPQARGILLSGAPLAVALGILVSHVLGTYLTWRVTAGICGAPPIFNVLLLFFVPESPMWLLSKKKFEAAKKSYLWFNGDSEEANKDFGVLLSKIQDQDEAEGKTPASSKWKLCLKSSFLKPFLILNFFFFVQQFSGVNSVAFYSVNILREILETMDEYVAMMIIDVVRFVASAVGVVLMKRFGRKQLSVASAIGTALSLFFLSLAVGIPKAAAPPTEAGANASSVSAILPADLASEANDNATLLADGMTAAESSGVLDQVVGYLPLLFLVTYIIFVSVGLMPIPWVLTGELFSKEMRGIGSGGTSSFGFLCFFAVVKLTPDFFQHMRNWGTFLFFGVVSLLGSVVLALFLPETKDKTLAEIEAHFRAKKVKSGPEGSDQDPARDVENTKTAR